MLPTDFKIVVNEGALASFFLKEVYTQGDQLILKTRSTECKFNQVFLLPVLFCMLNASLPCAAFKGTCKITEDIGWVPVSFCVGDSMWESTIFRLMLQFPSGGYSVVVITRDNIDIIVAKVLPYSVGEFYENGINKNFY